MSVIRLFIIFFCILLFPIRSNSQGIAPLFKCTQKLENPYGICTHFSRKGDRYDYSTMNGQLDMMRNIGINNVRGDIDYGSTNNNNTGLLDTILVRCKKYNINFLGIATDSEFYNLKWKSFNPYLGTLYKHYADKMQWMEFCNEIDLVKQEKVSERYISDLKQFHKIKKKNVKLKILSSGFADVKSERFDSIMEREAYKYFDIMNFHTYSVPEDIPVFLDIIRKKMDKYYLNKPVWLTECGMPTQVSKNGKEGERIGKEDEQARRVARIYLISFAYGVDKVFWYNFRSCEIDSTYSEDNFGLVHKNLTPKPSYYAYRTLVEMCPSGSTRPILTITDGVYRAEWTRPDKKHIIALWRKNGSTDYATATMYTKLYDYKGKEVKVENGRIKVSSGVVYIFSTK